MINVLWIDDEFQKNQAFIELAYLHDINITAFESSEEGIYELEINPSKYDAVILDANVKNLANDELTDTVGLRKTRDFLIGMHGRNIDLPYFIFTGQPEFVDSKPFNDAFGNFYIKAMDEETLLSDIIQSVSESEIRKIRNEYKSVFRIIEKHFSKAVRDNIFNILRNLKNHSIEDKGYSSFTQLRIILEEVFRIFNKVGILHDSCIVDGKVNLSESSMFLSGSRTRHLDLECSKSHFTPLISTMVKEIIFITGAASHSSGNSTKNTYDIKAHKNQVNSPYLFYACTFKLLDVLLWTGKYIEENSDIETNRSFWIDNSTTKT